MAADPVRALVAERDLWQCQRCCCLLSDFAGWSCHHMRLRSQGGADGPDNRVALCGTGTMGCHGWVHHNRTLARAAGYIRHGGDGPGSPVWSAPWRMWRVLAADGTWSAADDQPPRPDLGLAA